MSVRSSEIEAKWQERWYAARINEVETDGRPKFMIIFAYPGVTGYLHVGHMRGFSYVDAIARYKRMQGYNVLFPVGTHATGNGAISLATRIARRDEKTVDYLCGNGCPDEMLDAHGPAEGGGVLQRGLCQPVLEALRLPGRLEALHLAPPIPSTASSSSGSSAS